MTFSVMGEVIGVEVNRVRRGKHLRTLHISSLSIWDLGMGKGRVSTYLPLKAMCDRGHQVLYLTTDRKQKSGEIDGINIRKLRTALPASERKYWATFIDCFNSLFCTAQSLIISLRYKPDVIYAHDYRSAIAAFIVSKVAGSRYVLRQYGVATLNRLYRMLLYLPFKLPADMHIITNDGTLGAAAAKLYNVPSRKLCFWVNGIDKSWADGSMDHDLRRELASPNEKVVLLLSRLAVWKQVDVLIKAIPKVIEKYKATKFVIVGDGNQRAYLEGLAKELGVSDFVRFEGAVLHEKVLEYMKACDIFISMNRLSSICNPVLEAMISGKPVVALNTGATSDLIKHNHNGILVNADEIHRLPDAIVSLLRDEGLAKRIGEAAQRFMLDNWPTWEDRASLEVDLVEALCSDDSELIAAAKKRADSALNLAIRMADADSG